MTLVQVDDAVRTMALQRAQRATANLPLNHQAHVAAQRHVERLLAAVDARTHCWLCGKCARAYEALQRGRDPVGLERS